MRQLSLCSAFLVLLSIAAPAQFTITEILIDPVGANAGNQIVEVTNTSGAPFAANGWQICAPLTYAPLPIISIPAGGVVRIHLNAIGSNTATDWFINLRTLGTTDTLLLYKSSFFNNDNDIIDFVSWGGGNTRRQQAVNIGQWPNITDSVSLPSTEGRSIALDLNSATPNSAAAWYRDATPTLGTTNGVPLTTNLGVGCSTSLGTPALVEPSPAVDGNLDHRLQITGGPPNTFGFLAGGLQQAVPPIPLNGQLPGSCLIEVLGNVFVLHLTFDANGQVTVPLPAFVPGFNATGLPVFFQAVIADPAAPNLEFGMSPGLRVVIG